MHILFFTSDGYCAELSALQELLTDDGISFSVDTDLSGDKPDLIVAKGAASSRGVEAGHAAGIPVVWMIDAQDTDLTKHHITQEHFRVAQAVIFSSVEVFERFSAFNNGHFHIIPAESRDVYLHIFREHTPLALPLAKKGTSVSLIMRASKPDTLRDAVDASIALFPHYTEYIFAVSPEIPEDTVRYIRSIPRSKIIEGTAVREEAGDVHYRLIDSCSGTWIVNVDDDDLWTYAPDLTEVEDKVGLVYGQCFFMRYFRSLYDPERFFTETGISITSPESANRVPGSHWILRKKAWKSISAHLQDRSFNHSDWRIFYYLVKKGWTLQHEKHTFGIMKRFVYGFSREPGSKWIDTFHRLEKDPVKPESPRIQTCTYIAVAVVRSHEEYVSLLIDRLMQQTFPPDRIIILSDVLQELPPLPSNASPCPIEFHHAGTESFAEIVQRVMQSMEADYLLFTEVHDIIDPDFMQRSIDLLEKNTDVSGAYAHTQFFGQSKEIVTRPDAITWNTSDNAVHSIVLRAKTLAPMHSALQWESPWTDVCKPGSALQNTGLYNYRRMCPFSAPRKSPVKIYMLCSPSHRVLLEEFFLPSLQDPCELVIAEPDQLCVSGNYMTEGWHDIMTKKVELIVQAIEENWSSFFIHSDADVQFFGPILPDIESALEDNDMCIQCDRSDGEVCAGFFALRGNERTKALWTDVLEHMKQEPHSLNDQDWLNRILLHASDTHAVRWNYLPESFMNGFVSPARVWKSGDLLDVPDPCVMHHANWTVGVDDKIAQMRYVRDLMAKRTKATLIALSTPSV